MRLFQFQRNKQAQGFTLLEVLITVAIVGILAAIALPSYFDYVTRSKIIDATTALSDMRSKMEKSFADNRTYPNTATCTALLPPADYFTLSCTPAPTATTYTIVASGISAKGMGGFTYSIDQTNAKASSGPTGWTSSGSCWILRKDGSCS